MRRNGAQGADMNELTRWGLAALSLLEKITLSPLGGARPRRVEGNPAETLMLLAPRRSGGGLLSEALAARCSVREFTGQALSPELLSGLFWAADGVNRAGGGRTAPSALGMHAVDIYAATAAGLYRYDPAAHALQLVRAMDLRRLTGLQPFVDTAAVDIVFVEDRDREHLVGEATGENYAMVEAGAMAQNAALFCALNGLGSVVRAMIDRAPLARAMQLRDPQRILLAQTIGFPVAPGA
jgi:nitroreductase